MLGGLAVFFTLHLTAQSEPRPVWGQRPSPELGPVPVPPADVSLLPTRPRTKDVTGGFMVDTSAREEVRSFYNAIYPVSDGVLMDSTSDVTNCIPGTNAPAFYIAVLRRINWLRALAGIPASIALDGSYCVQDQQAAVMMSANTNLSHNPPTTWSCYTADGAAAANKSDLYLGNSGPGAITGYVQDFGGNNAAVGHRRWVLYPQTQMMGTGDVPAQNGLFAANATWVVDGNYYGPRPPTRQPFVSWPPPGFAPFPLVFPRWSLSFPQADFTAATVTMQSNGVPCSVRLETLESGIGENTLAWVPADLDANNSGTVWPFSGADTTYAVAVSNVVIGGVASNFNYTVTVFDPAVPGPDYQPPAISGPTQPGVGRNTLYTFTAIADASGYQWRQTQRLPFNWTDGAENGLGNFTADVSTGYPVIQSDVVASGSYAFHLAQPEPVDQILTLDHLVFPATNGVFSFKSRLGYATASQVAQVQASVDDGLTWRTLYSQAGDESAGETGFTPRTISLADFAGRSVRLRFNYHLALSGTYTYFNQTSTGVGWYLDDVTVTNAAEGVAPQITGTATNSFAFNPAQAISYNLEVRAVLFSEFPVEWGPATTVTATTATVPAVIVLENPSVIGGQVNLDFVLQSGAATTFRLLYANQLSGPWNVDASAILTTTVPGAAFRFSTALSGAARFYRVSTP